MGGHVNVLCSAYIRCCDAAEISEVAYPRDVSNGIVATLLVTTLQRSLGSLLSYLLLRCKDLWDRCYVTCYYAADDGEMTKNAPQFFKVSTTSNQLGTVVKSPIVDTMCTPMSTVSGPAG